MNREELDRMWNKALADAIRDGEEFTRYHFAALVAAAEREACAKLVFNSPPSDEYESALQAVYDAIRQSPVQAIYDAKRARGDA
jgi:hypothetical protein